jgi:hypothetical protein
MGIKEGKITTGNGTNALSMGDLRSGGDIIGQLTVTTDTLINIGYTYINTKSGSACIFTLPVIAHVGDCFQIVNTTLEGWELFTNAIASTQLIAKDVALSIASSSSSIIVYKSNSRYGTASFTYKGAGVWQVISGSSGAIIANNYGTKSDGGGDIATDTSLTSTADGDMIVKNYTNLIVRASKTLTTSNRCKGLLLYVDGDLTLEAGAKISMSSRGAYVNPTTAGVSSEGLKIKRFTSAGSTTNNVTDLLLGCGSAAVAITIR